MKKAPHFLMYQWLKTAHKNRKIVSKKKHFVRSLKNIQTLNSNTTRTSEAITLLSCTIPNPTNPTHAGGNFGPAARVGGLQPLSAFPWEPHLQVQKPISRVPYILNIHDNFDEDSVIFDKSGVRSFNFTLLCEQWTSWKKKFLSVSSSEQNCFL